MKYDNKIKKNKEKEEDINLERYIENESKRERELYDLVRDMFELERKFPPIPIILMRKPPIIKLRFEKLDTSLDPKLMERLGIKLKTDKKPMKIEWDD